MVTRSIYSWAVMAAVLATAEPIAGAQPVESERLLREAQALAKAGEYPRAIDVYKRADQLQPRAAISCFIGLAYVRRAAWGQAQVALDACRRRATDADPAPTWIDNAQRELGNQIQLARVPAVTFRVYPDDVTAKLAIVGWPSDETFSPRMLHLPIGRYAVDATASGGQTVRTEFEVTADAQTVEIYLRPVGKIVVELPTTRPPVAPAETRAEASGRTATKRPSRVVGYALLGGGGVAVAIGAVSHVLALRDRDRMQVSAEAWDAHRAAFGRERAFAIGGYAVGAALAAVGTYWLIRPHKSERISVAPLLPGTTGDPVGLAVEWMR